MTGPDNYSQRRWPIVALLMAVVLLLLAMVAVDLVVAQRVASRTGEIVLNTQRSIELVADLGRQAHRLMRSGLDPTQVRGIKTQIEKDAREYDPLANSPGERDEWMRLRVELDDLMSGVSSGEPGRASPQLGEIGTSIDRLVQINRDVAHDQAKAIRTLNRRALWADGLAGGVTLAVVLLIALVLFRVLARQRALTLEHIGLLAQRNQDLDAFAGRAAHDLQVPLTPIRGYADLILSDAASTPETKEMVGRIRTAVDRMSRVIQDMLELSRAGRPSRGSASPAEVAREVLEELTASLGDADVKLNVTDEPVACTPSLLAQIFWNLVSNSIKFRSASRPLIIAISAIAQGPQIEIVVEDNGIGIHDEEAPYVFEPFFRARTDREVPGYGLGLAIVHRAAVALGGTCHMDRGTADGTRIVVRLPRDLDGNPNRVPITSRALAPAGRARLR